MNAYTWAGGKRVPLHRVAQVAVDLDAVPDLEPDERDRLASRGRPLPHGLVLVDEDEAGALPGRRCAGVHPVYRYADGSRIVVLPEVRVEDEDPAHLDAVRRDLDGAHVVHAEQGRLVIAPDSGRGEDALKLADRLGESHDVEVAQARFLRLTARPGA